MLTFRQKLSKRMQNIFAGILLASLNGSVKKPNFPSPLKNANLTPVFKKDDRNSKNKYRQVSILPNMSKIFE